MNAAAGMFLRVGVLGGMGVEATIELLQRVRTATAAEDDEDHAPLFVDMNPQVPSRIRHIIEKTGPNPGPVLAQMAARLEQAGAKALAMPCNTAHFYASYITEGASIPLLNMPERACAVATQGIAPGQSVGILASPATNSTGLFERMLAKHGVKSIFPEDESEILAAIRSIKKQGPRQADIDLLERETRKLVDRGAARVIIGCTEFSLISKDLRVSVPVIDTLDVLVQAIVAFSGVRAK